MGCASGGAEASPEGEPERRSTRVRGAGARRARALSSSAVTGEEECMARFVNAQVPEVVQPVWAALQRGDSSPTPPWRARIASRARAGWRPMAACARAVAATSRAAA
jgi:hypothetical protein